MNNTKMLYLNRTDAFEGTYVNKTSVSNECDICHYWYFLNKEFQFQPNVCNRCHDLLMMSINFSNIFKRLKISIIVALLLELAKVNQ